MNCYNLYQKLENKEFINLKKLSPRSFGISLLWFIFWMIIYAVSAFIKPELVFIPMLLNLPLATFFCIGIILETLIIVILNYDQSYDLWGKLIVLLLTFVINYFYRQTIFKEQKSIKSRIKSRVKEFFIWIIPWLIIIFILGQISSLIQ
ncbi:hypothetical protein GM3708_1399 [Geminocystis sp. NIES-3708]|uniref:hypothetical protein n=1 Tax=Geminocystis sp. NIES-3708 TaxID=1615909 RepID=UPI0005FC3F1E|nr:hypothetical protein [Geminocystis sp. NIES-3708]BAQ60993.1 hypothetical protein GM3708_1399 [Geminocystis sp. NIES-3708]